MMEQAEVPKGREVAPGLIQEAMFEAPVIDVDAGARLKAKGQARAIDARINDEWRRRAELALERLIDTTPRFSADDVAIMAGLPPSRNGMGALFGGYARLGRIVPVGWTTGKRRDRHAGSQRVWRKA